MVSYIVLPGTRGTDSGMPKIRQGSRREMTFRESIEAHSAVPTLEAPRNILTPDD